MKFFSFRVAALLASAVIFSSCEDDEPKPVTFHVEAQAYSTSIKDFAGTTATLTVTGDGNELYSGELPASGFSDLEIKEGLTTYHVTIKKQNYDTFEADFTEEELAQPLQVRLYLTLSNGLAAWGLYFAHGNREYYHHSHGVFPYGASVA